MILSLKLCLVSNVQWDSGARPRAEETCPTHVSTVPSPCVCIWHSHCPGSAAFWRTRSETQSKQEVLHPGLVSGGADSRKRPRLPFEPQFVSNAERRWWRSNTKTKEPYHILSHLHSYYFPVLASHLHCDDTEGRRKIRQPRDPFPFRNSLLGSKAQ